LNLCTNVHTFGDDYEWDQKKADVNVAKHGIDFPHAVEALLDEGALTVADEGSGEERYVSFGMDALGRLIAVVYTWRGDVIRIISARKATRTEARFYAEANQ
jgi:uncharacterized DUF497 family protein